MYTLTANFTEIALRWATELRLKGAAEPEDLALIQRMEDQPIVVLNESEVDTVVSWFHESRALDSESLSLYESLTCFIPVGETPVVPIKTLLCKPGMHVKEIEGEMYLTLRFDDDAVNYRAARAALFTYAAQVKGETATELYRILTEVEVNDK